MKEDGRRRVVAGEGGQCFNARAPSPPDGAATLRGTRAPLRLGSPNSGTAADGGALCRRWPALRLCGSARGTPEDGGQDRRKMPCASGSVQVGR